LASNTDGAQASIAELRYPVRAVQVRGMAPARSAVMRFVIATLHYAGLGFALRLLEEGHQVVLAPVGTTDRRMCAGYELIGNGLVEKRSLAAMIGDRSSYRDAIWIWDENHSVDENELLRAEGFRVFGGGRYCDTMEHDRAACLAFVAKYGLLPPPSESFTDREAAIRFLEQNADKSYVCKPDHGETYETFLPQSDRPEEANTELRGHLHAMQSESPFVLQERKDGVEANVEVWMVRGEPRFAFATLEAKRKLTGDLGDFAACAFDFTFVVRLESEIVKQTVGRLFPAYQEMKYTGFADANFIAARDGVWFLEKCERFGYNAHPNVLWTLNRDPLATVFSSLDDGGFQPNFSSGFGAACTMYMDHRFPGGVIQFPKSVEKDLYLYDVQRQGDQLLTCGYYDDVLLATGFGHTIPGAWDAAMTVAKEVKFPGRSFRTDGGGVDYPSSPLRRYEALQAMGWL
jgi:phosphoribosylamine-glycine ligase